MKVEKFDITKAEDGHNGTIKTHEVLPKDWIKAPFRTAWGYLPGPGEMEGHSHPDDEIYMIFKGKGRVSVGSEEMEVSAGDIVEIPSEEYHVMRNENEEELLWAAFWWEK